MIDDTDALLDDILRRWHGWAASIPPETGFPAENVSCRLWRTSRQHDSENGALDTDLHSRTMSAVDWCVEQIDQPYRTAIYINARNLWTGVTVWTSARLPDDRQKRAELVAEARARLLVLLRRDGVA